MSDKEPDKDLEKKAHEFAVPIWREFITCPELTAKIARFAQEVRDEKWNWKVYYEDLMKELETESQAREKGEAKIDHLGGVLTGLNERLEEERRLRKEVEKKLEVYLYDVRLNWLTRELEAERKLGDELAKALHHTMVPGMILTLEQKEALTAHRKARKK